jgi:arylsulfatase
MRQGDWKLSRPASPQAAWRLFDLAADPGETRDIAAAKPSLAARLAEYWRRYAAANGVVSPEPSGVGR